VRVSRRIFLADAGKAIIAAGLIGATCSDRGDAPPSLTAEVRGGSRWNPVDLGSVYAFVVVREGEAAIIDTGVAGSADDIEAVLTAPGLVGWDDVGHVILTHSHPDHAGSLAQVLERAPEAVGYIGAGDKDSVTSPRPLTTVGDGDTIMALEVVETPGHTPGHICLLDRELSTLFAGDALTGSDGTVAGPNARFTADMPMAVGSVSKLAALTFETIAFGHGAPVDATADDLTGLVAAK
jgi:glyoxylase-like metal-dependent hydrolase (beta-lactamase superfamily II)